jgi:thiamine biosynthesis protein ThiS
MNVTLKLYASLADYLPADARLNQVRIELSDDSTIAAVIERYGLPQRLTHLVLVNGVFVPPSERAGTRLRDGDHLAIWPPIAGG